MVSLSVFNNFTNNLYKKKQLFSRNKEIFKKLLIAIIIANHDKLKSDKFDLSNPNFKPFNSL